MSDLQETEPRHDPDLPATKVIFKWGSNARFARAIDRAPTTTYRWLNAGQIPLEAMPEVMAAAKRDAVLIEKDDLIDLRLFGETVATDAAA